MVWGNCGEGLKEATETPKPCAHIQFVRVYYNLRSCISICVRVFHFVFVYFI
jgi:hypothetical protein